MTKYKNSKIQTRQNTKEQNTNCPTHPNQKLRLETELCKMAHKSLKRTIIVTKNVKVTIKSLKSVTARLKTIKKQKYLSV